MIQYYYKVHDFVNALVNEVINFVFQVYHEILTSFQLRNIPHTAFEKKTKQKKGWR